MSSFVHDWLRWGTDLSIDTSANALRTFDAASQAVTDTSAQVAEAVDEVTVTPEEVRSDVRDVATDVGEELADAARDSAETIAKEAAAAAKTVAWILGGAVAISVIAVTTGLVLQAQSKGNR